MQVPDQSRKYISPSWRNGNAINSGHLTPLTRSAVFKKGSNPAAFSLNSIRDEWANALHHATKDVELVARVGRRGAKSISPYLWEIPQMLAALGVLMVGNPNTRYIRRPKGWNSKPIGPICGGGRVKTRISLNFYAIKFGRRISIVKNLVGWARIP